jgi:hypothetical protein
MTAVRRLPLTLLLAAATVAGLVVAPLLPASEDAGEDANGEQDPEDEELTVPDDATVVGVEQGVMSGISGLNIGLSRSDGTLASAHFATASETYGESRMPVGRRVVVGDWDIELGLLDDDYAEFWVREVDRDPAEPVGLRPPGGTRSYPPGFSVHLRLWDGDAALLTVAVRVDPEDRTIEGWEERDLELAEGETVEVDGYRIAWHDRLDDELLVTLHGPDGEPVADAG